MRLADALARFQVQLQADGRSPHTVAQYAHVRWFEAWLEAESLPDDIAQLEPEHVARFLASAEALTPPSRTVATWLSSRSCLDSRAG